MSCRRELQALRGIDPGGGPISRVLDSEDRGPRRDFDQRAGEIRNTSYDVSRSTVEALNEIGFHHHRSGSLSSLLRNLIGVEVMVRANDPYVRGRIVALDDVRSSTREPSECHLVTSLVAKERIVGIHMSAST